MSIRFNPRVHYALIRWFFYWEYAVEEGDRVSGNGNKMFVFIQELYVATDKSPPSKVVKLGKIKNW